MPTLNSQLLSLLYEKNSLFSLSKFLRLFVSSSFIFCSSFSAMAIEDDYLKAMEIEAESVYLDSAATNKSAESTASDGSLSEQNHVQISSQQRQEFESVLQERLPRSFDSYMKLNDQNKMIVIDTYFSNSRNVLIAVSKLYKLHFKK